MGPATDFHEFVWGDGVITSLWAHTWGKVRPRLRDRVHEIVAVGTPMSCVAGEGRLWTAATTNGGCLITWENFVVGRRKKEEVRSSVAEAFGSNFSACTVETRSVSEGTFAVGEPEGRTSGCENGELRTETRSSSQASATSDASVLRAKNSDLVSAQMEFFPNGDFITRSNNVECVYRRVNPDDWDDDGIANEEDDEPRIAADESRFGPNQTLPDGANSNAYCWVDLVVPQANAKVTFAGDGVSNLADPSFIAKAGEAHRVAILIGKTYRVTCPLPFRIAAKSSDEIEENWNGENEVELCWSVGIFVQNENDASAASAASLLQSASLLSLSSPMLLAEASSASTTHSFSMRVSPSGLGGTFDWTKCCCAVSGSGADFSICCSSGCLCSGCSASGYYSYEGFRLPVDGGACGCGTEDHPPEPDPEEPEEPTPVAGVSVSFTKNAIIFEDEYEALEGVTVPRRSTRSTLVCSASGGAEGGVATFEIEGESRLARVSGLSLPITKTLGANEMFSTQIVYEGKPGSGSQPKVTAKFVSNGNSEDVLEASDDLTIAQIEIVVHKRPSANESAYRHKFGIREIFSCNSYPSGTGLRWIASEGCLLDSDQNYQCPSRASVNPIKAVCGDAEFVPQITVVEPSDAEGRNPRCLTYGVPAGRAGWIGLHQDFHIRPLDVSFEWLMVEEVPCSVGERRGYFSHPSFAVIGSHSEELGAGVWCEIGADNRMGEGDNARITTELMRVDSDGNFTEDETCGWEDGSISWDIPFGWTSVLTASRHADTKPEQVFDSGTKQCFTITPAGSVTVEKFGNTARRDIDGTTYCNNVKDGGVK